MKLCLSSLTHGKSEDLLLNERVLSAYALAGEARAAGQLYILRGLHLIGKAVRRQMQKFEQDSQLRTLFIG